MAPIPDKHLLYTYNNSCILKILLCWKKAIT